MPTFAISLLRIFMFWWYDGAWRGYSEFFTGGGKKSPGNWSLYR